MENSSFGIPAHSSLERFSVASVPSLCVSVSSELGIGSFLGFWSEEEVKAKVEVEAMVEMKAKGQRKRSLQVPENANG